MCREAYDWYASNPMVIEIEKYGEFIVYLAANDNLNIDNSSELIEFKNKLYETFDEYKKNHDNVHTIQLKNEKRNWLKHSTCTCIKFQKTLICKHLLGLAFFNKLKKCPEEGNNVLIGQKLKRGRVPRAKMALMKH